MHKGEHTHSKRTATVERISREHMQFALLWMQIVPVTLMSAAAPRIPIMRRRNEVEFRAEN
jgi:hypothetical protein